MTDQKFCTIATPKTLLSYSLMKKRKAAIPEGGVFVVPITSSLGVCAQVWTLDSRTRLANCGISRLTTPKGVLPSGIQWSDASLYDCEVNIILDDEWTNIGWPIQSGFPPAKRPLRDGESFFRRMLYDYFGWRPEISSFRLPEQVTEFVTERMTHWPNQTSA